MGLIGSLEDLSLLDILQIVNVSKRTGILRLNLQKEHFYYIYFSSGKITDILGDFDEFEFIDLFESQGLIDPSEKKEVFASCGKDPKKAIEIMVEKDYLNDRLLEQARRQELGRRLKFLTKESNSGEFSFFLAEEMQVANAPPTFYALSEPVPPQALLTQSFIEERAPNLQPKHEIVKETLPISNISGKRGQKTEIEEEIVDLSDEDVEVIHPIQKAKEIVLEEKEAINLTPPMPRINPAKSAITIILVSEESIFKNILWQNLIEHFSFVERVSNLKDYITVTKTLLEKKRPFIVITDLLMATMDGKGYTGGLEILDRSREEFPEVKIFLLSDIEDPRMDDIAIAKGAIKVIRKPDLARLKLGEIETAISEFAEHLTRQIDEILPPQEEEVVRFFKELGAEPTPDGVKVRDQLSFLKGLLGELANPKESSEISLLVLRLASEYFERAILLLVKRGEIIGLGGFGLTGDQEPMSKKVVRLRMPTDVDATWKKVIEEKSPLLINFEDATDIDRSFCQAIGNFSPKEFVYIPMLSRGRVIAILYADNAVSNEPIKDLSAMEIFMIQAGLAMERALLERQLLSLKKGIESGDKNK
jgi:CheY-like chemotaxis protein